MKTYKVEIEIYSLVGREIREFEIKAKTESSARKKAATIMGNRDYSIQKVTVQS